MAAMKMLPMVEQEQLSKEVCLGRILPAASHHHNIAVVLPSVSAFAGPLFYVPVLMLPVLKLAEARKLKR